MDKTTKTRAPRPLSPDAQNVLATLTGAGTVLHASEIATALSTHGSPTRDRPGLTGQGKHKPLDGGVSPYRRVINAVRVLIKRGLVRRVGDNEGRFEATGVELAVVEQADGRAA